MSFDIPDSYKKYWHDIEKIKPYFSKRQYGCGSAMVRGTFAVNVTLPVAVIDTKMNADKYQNLLIDNLLPNAPLVTLKDWKFRQNNACMYVSHSTRAWFIENEVCLVGNPATGFKPDVNYLSLTCGISLLGHATISRERRTD